MTYSVGENQDAGCKKCGCRCGYYLARERDGWSVPGSNGGSEKKNIVRRVTDDGVIIEEWI